MFIIEGLRLELIIYNLKSNHLQNRFIYYSFKRFIEKTIELLD